MSGGARTCPHGGHGRMAQYVTHAHDPEPGECHAVWKCGRCFHQWSIPFGCFDAARERWERLRDALAGNVPLIAVLDVHRPVHAWRGVECSECLKADEGETVAADWPCKTHKVIEGAA